METALVGRQPIFTRDLDIHAYELLFRSEGADSAEATVSTLRVFSDRVIHLILEVTDDGEPELTSYKRMVVNLTYL